MGSGVSVPGAQATAAGEGQVVPLELFQQEKDRLIAENQECELQLENLKSSTTVLLQENERLKHALSRDMNALFPEVFVDTQSPDELVDDWLLMDLFEGDKFTDFLKVLYPPVEDLVAAVLRTSAMNKKKETSLPEYLAYFQYRFEETGKILMLIGEERHNIDDCVQQTKTKLVQSIKIFETFFGKKSKEVDELSLIFAKFGGLMVGVPFISGMQTFYETALERYRQAYEAKLQAAAEALEIMRQNFEKQIADLTADYERRLKDKEEALVSTKKRFDDIMRKHLNEMQMDRMSHYVDLDNQFTHFALHMKKVQRDFEKSQSTLRSHYESLVERLQQEIQFRNEKINSNEAEIQSLNNLTHDWRSNLRELETLRDSNKIQISKLKGVIMEQTLKIEDYQKEMRVKAAVEHENRQMRSELDRLKKVKSDLEEQLQNALREISSGQAHIKQHQSQRQSELAVEKERRLQACAVRVFSRLSARARVEKTALLLTWRTIVCYKPLPEPVAVVPAAPKPAVTLNITDQVVFESYSEEQKQFAANVTNFIYESTLRKNDLMERYVPKDSDEKPMMAQQIFKIFEEMMSRKYESDVTDIRNDRIPKPIPTFLVEHLIRTLGLQQLAVKTLGQFLPGLRDLQAASHPYGLVICQMLQVLVENPVHNLMGWYLTQALFQFRTVTEKYAKQKADISSKRGVKSGSVPMTPRMKRMMKTYYGGDAFFQDIFPLIMAMFQENRTVGERVIQLLQPEDFTTEEYTTFAVNDRIAKLARTPEKVFRMLDTSGVGSIFEGEFVTRLKELVDVWVPESNLRTLFRSSMRSEKRMNIAQFVNCLNFKTYPAKSVNDQYTTSTCHFLAALIQVFQENESVYLMQVKRLIEKHSIQEITLSEFSILLNTLDPTLSVEDVAGIWDQARAEGKSDVLNLQQFASVVAMHPVGSLKESLFCQAEGELCHEAEGDEGLSRLEYKVAGVQVFKICVKVPQTEVSFQLTETEESEREASTSPALPSSPLSPPIFSHSPFHRKPIFPRSFPTVPQIPIQLSQPSLETTARYPKPSLSTWLRGTKRAYEDVYFYRDFEGEL